MRSNHLLLIIITTFFSQFLFAQEAEPMYAIRKDLRWEFYNSKNELMFPVKRAIGPQMIPSFYHGWCKVQRAQVKGGDVVLQDGVIDQKGEFKELPAVPAGFLIMGVDLVEGQKILFWSNWNERFFMNPDGKKVPEQPSETATWLEGGLLYTNEVVGIYEVWDILKAKRLFKIEADDLGRHTEDLLAVKQKGLWGAVNLKGEWVIEPQFKAAGAFDLESEYAFEPEATFRNGLLAVSKDSVNWGFVNAKGKWKVSPQFSEILDVGQGYWMGKTEKGWQLISPKGKIMKSVLLEDAPTQALLGELIIGSSAIYNLKGKQIHQTADAYQILGDGFFVARMDDQLTLYKGRKMIKKLPKEIKLMKIHPFSNGLATVQVFKEGGKGYIGFINQQGEWVIEPNLDASYGGSGVPVASKTFIYLRIKRKHVFYGHDGNLITEIASDGSWDMFSVLEDGNSGFWAPM